MLPGKPFEVSKEVFDRAKENAIDKEQGSFYMTSDDEKELFDESIRCGYGLYNCKVHEERGKYICTWWRGDSCD